MKKQDETLNKLLNLKREELINLSKDELNLIIEQIDSKIQSLHDGTKYDLLLKKIEILKILGNSSDTILLLKDIVNNIDEKKYPLYKKEFLIELGKYYTISGKFYKGLDCYALAKKLLKSNNKKEQIRIMMLEAEIFSKSYKFDEATTIFKNILTLSTSKKFDMERANCYSDMGLMEIRRKNFKQALKFYLISEKIYEKLKADDYLYLVYANISLIYFKQSSYKEAINYSQKAAKVGEKLKEWLKVSRIYNNLGTIYLTIKDYKNAEKYLKEAIKLKIKTADKIGLSKVLNNISEILISQKNYKDAKKYLGMSYKIKEKINDNTGKLYTLSNLAHISYKTKNYKEGLDYLSKAKKLLKEYGTYENYINIYKNYYQIYERMNNYKMAIKYYNLFETKYFKYKKRLYDNEMQNLLKKFEDDRAEKEKKLQYIKNIQLKKANENKNRLFSIIAHDLKSPFSSIISFISLMKHGYGKYPPEKIHSWVLELEKIVNETFLLLENLLTWSKLHSKAITYEPTFFNLRKLINEILNIYIANANRKNIEIKNKIPNDIILFADRFMIQTVVRNLLNNAIKFTPEYGTITLSASKNKENIEISVEDTGVGISEENIQKLFKLETSFTTSGTNREKGTGLGLIVCYDFVKANGGKISVKSKIGLGTTFIISLPLKK